MRIDSAGSGRLVATGTLSPPPHAARVVHDRFSWKGEVMFRAFNKGDALTIPSEHSQDLTQERKLG